MRVLIVDDDALFRIPLRATLALEGFEIHTADSAEAAEAVLGHEEIDVVLSDIGLPGMNGVALATRHPGIPFVLMTGSTTPEPPASPLPLTVRARLMKPFETSDVVAVLHEAIGRHQGRHRL